MMVGTAAATLVGLLFVSLSLRADEIGSNANVGSRMLAAQAFTSFLSVLMFAVLFLIPDQGPFGLGLPLVGVGAYGLYRTIQRLFEARRARARAWGTVSVARQMAVSACCYVSLLAVAASVLLGRTAGLYWLVPVMIVLILDASLNAWYLLLQVRIGRAGA